MPYVGRDLQRGNYLKLDDISSSFDGSTTTFNLTSGGNAFFPGSAFSIIVSLGGVVQEPESAFQIEKSQIIFAQAPTPNDDFFCIVQGVALGVGVPGHSTVGGDHLAKPISYGDYFRWDSTNNRVGINTLSPSVTLDVVGDASFSGNVGVKTLTPSVALDVVGDASFSGNVAIGGTLTYEDVANIDAVGLITARAGIQDKTLTQGRVVFVGNSNRLVDNSNLTFDGTTLNSTTLNVSGVSTFTNELQIAPSNSSSYVTHLNYNNTGTNFISHANSGGTFFRNSTSGQTAVIIQGSNNAVDVNAQIRHLGDTDTLMEFGDNTISFDTAGGKRLTIKSDGKTGIGTTAPLRKVDVVGNSLLVRPTHQNVDSSGNASAVNNSIIIRMPYGENPASTNHSGARFGIQFTGANNTTDASSLNFGNDPVKSASIYGVSEDFLGYNRKVGLAFYTSALDTAQEERFRIASDGKVGIATNNPTAILDIRDKHFNKYLTIHGGGSPNRMIIDSHEGDGGGADIDLASDGDTKVRITSSGNVGIKQNSPSALFQVGHPNSITGVLRADPGYVSIDAGYVSGGSQGGVVGSASTAALIFGGDGDTGLYHSASDTLNFTTGGTERLRILSNGNISVGSNGAAAEKFQVNSGSIAIVGGGSYKIDTHPLVSYASFTDISGGSYAARLGSTGTSTIRSTQIYGGGGHIATFDGVNKRLGINTTVPQARLHVVGGTASGTAYDAAVFAGGQNSTSGSGVKLYLTGCENDPLSRGVILESIMTDNSNAHRFSILVGGSSAAPTEKLRIDSSGSVRINGDDYAYSANVAADDLIIGDNSISEWMGLTIASNSGYGGAIYFGDESHKRGYIQYRHNGDRFEIGTAGSERLRIDSDGQLCLTGTNGGVDTTPGLNGFNAYYEIDQGQVTLGAYSSGGTTHMAFYTNESGNAMSQKMCLQGDGRLGLGIDTATAGDLATGDSQNHPLLHVYGTTRTSSDTGGEFNLLGRFEAGGDADNTGAMIVLNHSNDRGLALIGGRGSSNRSFGAIKSIDNVGRLTNVMAFGGDNGQGVEYLKFYTGDSTTTTERLRITSDGFVHVGGATLSPEAPLHVTAENSQGINAIFGAKDFIDHNSYNYADANIALQGRDADDNDTGAGIQFTVRTTANNNWLHGAITMDQSGNYIFKNGGAGTTVGTEKLRIASTGAVCVGSGYQSGGGGHLTIRGGGINTYACQDYQYVGTPSNTNTLAQIRFTANTSGASVIQGAKIQAVADADWSATGDAPTRLEFHTAADGSASTGRKFWIDSNAAYLQGLNHTSFQVRSGTGNVKGVLQTVQDTEVRMGCNTNHPLAIYAGTLERLRITADGEVHISDRNSSNTGEHFFQAGSFGIRMEDTGGYNRWNIERNYGGYQSIPLIHLSAQGVVGINTTNPQSALHVRGAGGIRIDTLSGTPIASNSNVVTDASGNPYLSGTPWFETSPYLYNTGNSPSMDYYWIKIIQSMSSSAICYIEYMSHSDSNYPRSVHGKIDIGKYANVSISISHNTITPLTGITPQVVIDSYQRVWVKMKSAQWNSDFRFRVVYSEGTTINTNFTVGTDNNSTTVGRLLDQDATPQDMSGIIEPGATMRWDLSNSNPPLYWGGTDSSNNNNVSTTAGTFGDGIQDYNSGQSHFNKMRIKGKMNCTAGWNDHGMIMTSNYIGVNNGSQPVLMSLKSQKNTTLELNRMYSHGEILQFKQNNSNVGYFNVSGTTSTHTSTGSDIRLKKDIEDWTEEVLPYFKSLKPQKFRFNSEDETAEKTKGYMAQDNLDKFPEAYPLNSQDDRYWFAPQHMIPYLMKALQEEIIKREEIEAKYNALEARISALESS